MLTRPWISDPVPGSDRTDRIGDVETTERKNRMAWGGSGLMILPQIPDISQLFRDAIRWLLWNAVEGLLDTLAVLFSLGFETFLFYPDPSGIEILATLWRISFGTFVVLAGLSSLYVLLLAQYFPGEDAADIQYHLERVVKYFVFVFLSREAISFAVAATHALAAMYYRPSYDLSVGVTAIRRAIDGLGVFLAFQLGVLTSGALLFAGLVLILLLVARMLVVYVTYALYPLLLGFQLVDVGPWAHINELGRKFIRTSAKLMLFGIIVTAVMWTGTSLIDSGQYDESAPTITEDDPLSGSSSDAMSALSPITPVIDLLYLLTPLVLIDLLGMTLLMSMI